MIAPDGASRAALARLRAAHDPGGAAEGGATRVAPRPPARQPR